MHRSFIKTPYKGALLPENIHANDPQIEKNLEKLDGSFFYTISHINSFHSE